MNGNTGELTPEEKKRRVAVYQFHLKLAARLGMTPSPRRKHSTHSLFAFPGNANSDVDFDGVENIECAAEAIWGSGFSSGRESAQMQFRAAIGL